MTHGLSEETVSKITGVLAAHSEVEKVVLYGSRAKGNYKNGSDIDLSPLFTKLHLVNPLSFEAGLPVSSPFKLVNLHDA